MPHHATTPDVHVLLVLRTPPPYGGGEMVALSLLEAFRGKFDILEFTRMRHSKQTQGRLSLENLRFGLRYIIITVARVIRTRPTVLYLDIPKDFPSFLRTSVILFFAHALRIAVVGDLAGAAFPFLEGGGWKRRFGLLFLRPVFAIRVLSPSLVARMQSAGLSNGVSISNGITDIATNGPSERQLPPVPQFLYVGKLAPAKGLWTILEFLELCKTMNHPVHVHLVGEWENAALHAEVMAWVRAHGVEPMLTVHGLLLDQKKWDVYRKATVLLHPTLWDGQPVTILEAFAFGIPVISTNVGAIPDTVVHGATGYIMKENSAQEVSRGAESILGDPATYSRYAKEARKSFDERYRRDLFLQHMEELFTRASACSTESGRP